MQVPFFFGYGSLMNTATHDYPDPAPAQVVGWRRIWRQTTVRKAAFLSVERAEGVQIDGLLAAVPRADWTALDAREYAYNRHALQRDDVVHDHPRAADVQLYATRPDLAAPVSDAHPILLSYLDTVVQGVLRIYGPQGVARFFDTTAGWEGVVLNDRAAPIYSRAQELDAEERALVDSHLARLSAVV